MKVFEEKELQKIYKPQDIGKGGNGQVLIIGGSSLFHGAPLLSLKTASRVVDMVFFSSPEPSVGATACQLKSQIGSFIWVPFNHVEEYLVKSDAVLIGPGLMRYRKKDESSSNKNGRRTKKMTESLLAKFP